MNVDFTQYNKDLQASLVTPTLTQNKANRLAERTASKARRLSVSDVNTLSPMELQEQASNLMLQQLYRDDKGLYRYDFDTLDSEGNWANPNKKIRFNEVNQYGQPNIENYYIDNNTNNTEMKAGIARSDVNPNFINPTTGVPITPFEARYMDKKDKPSPYLGGGSKYDGTPGSLGVTPGDGALLDITLPYNTASTLEQIRLQNKGELENRSSGITKQDYYAAKKLRGPGASEYSPSITNEELGIQASPMWNVGYKGKDEELPKDTYMPMEGKFTTETGSSSRGLTDKEYEKLKEELKEPNGRVENWVDALQFSFGRMGAEVGDAIIDAGVRIGKEGAKALTDLTEDDINTALTKGTLGKTKLFDKNMNFTYFDKYKTGKEYGYDNTRVIEVQEDVSAAWKSGDPIQIAGAVLSAIPKAGPEFALESFAEMAGGVGTLPSKAGLTAFSLLAAKYDNEMLEDREKITGRPATNAERLGTGIAAIAVAGLNRLGAGEAIGDTNVVNTLLSTVIKDGTEGAVKSALKSAVKVLAVTGGKGTYEGLEEVVQDYTQQIGTKYGTKKEKDLTNYNKVGEASLQSFTGGMAAGSTISAAGQGYSTIADGKKPTTPTTGDTEVQEVPEPEVARQEPPKVKRTAKESTEAFGAAYAEKLKGSAPKMEILQLTQNHLDEVRGMEDSPDKVHFESLLKGVVEQTKSDIIKELDSDKSSDTINTINKSFGSDPVMEDTIFNAEEAGDTKLADKIIEASDKLGTKEAKEVKAKVESIKEEVKILKSIKQVEDEVTKGSKGYGTYFKDAKKGIYDLITANKNNDEEGQDKAFKTVTDNLKRLDSFKKSQTAKLSKLQEAEAEGIQKMADEVSIPLTSNNYKEIALAHIKKYYHGKLPYTKIPVKYSKYSDPFDMDIGHIASHYAKGSNIGLYKTMGEIENSINSMDKLTGNINDRIAALNEAPTDTNKVPTSDEVVSKGTLPIQEDSKPTGAPTVSDEVITEDSVDTKDTTVTGKVKGESVAAKAIKESKVPNNTIVDKLKQVDPEYSEYTQEDVDNGTITEEELTSLQEEKDDVPNTLISLVERNKLPIRVVRDTIKELEEDIGAIQTPDKPNLINKLLETSTVSEKELAKALENETPAAVDYSEEDVADGTITEADLKSLHGEDGEFDGTLVRLIDNGLLPVKLVKHTINMLEKESASDNKDKAPTSPKGKVEDKVPATPTKTPSEQSIAQLTSDEPEIPTVPDYVTDDEVIVDYGGHSIDEEIDYTDTTVYEEEATTIRDMFKDVSTEGKSKAEAFLIKSIQNDTTGKVTEAVIADIDELQGRIESINDVIANSEGGLSKDFDRTAALKNTRNKLSKIIEDVNAKITDAKERKAHEATLTKNIVNLAKAQAKIANEIKSLKLGKAGPLKGAKALTTKINAMYDKTKPKIKTTKQASKAKATFKEQQAESEDSIRGTKAIKEILSDSINKGRTAKAGEGIGKTLRQSLAKVKQDLVASLPANIYEPVKNSTSRISASNMKVDAISDTSAAIAYDVMDTLKTVLAPANSMEEVEFTDKQGNVKKSKATNREYEHWSNSPGRSLLFDSNGDIQPNVALAIGASVFELIGLGSSEIGINDSNSISRALTIQEHEVTPAMRTLLKEGSFRKLVAFKLGKSIETSLGIRVRDDASTVESQRFTTDLGNMALLYAQERGYIKPMTKENSIKVEEYNQIVGSSSDVAEGSIIPMVTLSHLDNAREKAKMVANSKAVFEDLEKVLKIERTVKGVLFKKPKVTTKSKMRKNEATVEPEESKDVISNVLEPTEYGVHMEAVNRLKKFTREQALKVMGFKTALEMNGQEASEGKKYIPGMAKDDREGQVAKNAALVAEYDDLMELHNTVDTKKENNKMWFEWFFTKNGRFILDSIGINPQTNKNLHRWLVSPLKQHNNLIMMNSKKDVTVFKLAVNQSFGVSIDKLSEETNMKVADHILAMDADELETLISEKAKIDTGLKESNGKAIKLEAEHLGHAIQGLLAVEAYNNRTKVNGVEQFETGIAVEFDAVTSGFILKLMQMPIIKDTEISLTDWLAKGAIFIKDAFSFGNKESMGSKIENKVITDTYVTSARTLENRDKFESVEMVKGKPKVEDSYGLYDITNRLSPEVTKDGVVQSFGRLLLKYPTMMFNYGSALATIKKYVSVELTQDIPNIAIDRVEGKEFRDKLLEVQNIPNTEEAHNKLIKEFKNTSFTYITLNINGKKVKLQEHLESLMVDQYGTQVADVFELNFGDMIRANEKTRNAFRAMTRLFIMDYDRQLSYINKPTKGDEADVLKSLMNKYPALRAPLSNTEGFDDYISIMSKGKATAANASVSTALNTNIEQKSGTTSITTKALLTRFEEAISSGVVLPIHYIDGTIMALTLKLGELGVHDAIVLGILGAMDTVKRYNKNVYEVSKNYSVVEETLKSLERAIEASSEADILDVDINNAEETGGRVLKDSKGNALTIGEIQAEFNKLADEVRAEREELFSKDMRIDHMIATKDSAYEVIGSKTRKAKAEPEAKASDIKEALVKTFADRGIEANVRNVSELLFKEITKVVISGKEKTTIEDNLEAIKGVMSKTQLKAYNIAEADGAGIAYIASQFATVVKFRKEVGKITEEDTPANFASRFLSTAKKIVKFIKGDDTELSRALLNVIGRGIRNKDVKSHRVLIGKVLGDKYSDTHLAIIKALNEFDKECN